MFKICHRPCCGFSSKKVCISDDVFLPSKIKKLTVADKDLAFQVMYFVIHLFIPLYCYKMKYLNAQHTLLRQQKQK